MTEKNITKNAKKRVIQQHLTVVPILLFLLLLSVLIWSSKLNVFFTFAVKPQSTAKTRKWGIKMINVGKLRMFS